MATYLVLSNRVLNDLNEVELTSSNFSSSRGVQTSVKNFVNRALHDIYNDLEELPSLYKETYHTTYAGQREYALPTSNSPVSGDAQWRKVDWDSFILKPNELVTNGEFTSNISGWTTGDGSPSYTSSGNGRLNLNDAAAYQSISTVKNTKYRLQVKIFSPNSSTSTVAIKVGTTASGGETLSTTKKVTNFREGAVLNTTFTAEAQTSYIFFETTSGVQIDIDYVRISRDTYPQKLKYMTYDDWWRQYAERDLDNNSDAYGEPEFIYKTQSGKIGISPIPDRSDYRISFEYWKEHTELSAHGDEPDLDDRYADLIVKRAKYYAYQLRSDPDHAAIANREYQDGLDALNRDLIGKPSYMRDFRVNYA